MKINDKQLNRAIYSLWDFQQALSALTFLLEECDFDAEYSHIEMRRFRCYESTLIISMARPFETTRSGTTIGLRALGISLNQEQKDLKRKILDLRGKVIAHSAEEGMYYRVSTHPVLDGEFNFPHFQFDERLYLNENELRDLEFFLRYLKSKIADFFFQVAQENPNLLEHYQKPKPKT